MYSSRKRWRAHFRGNSVHRTISKLIPPPGIHDRSTRSNGKKPSSKSMSDARRLQQEGQDSTNCQPATFRHKKTAKALEKEAKIASAPRRARVTLITVSIITAVVGRFRLTPRGERKLKKLYKAISRNENRQLQDFLQAKGAKKRKTTKRRAQRLARWNLQKRFDVREEICAGSPGFSDGVLGAGDEARPSPESSDDGDDGGDGDYGCTSGGRRTEDIKFRPNTPFNMDGRTGEAEGLRETDHLPDPETEVVLSICIDWQNSDFEHQRELRVVFPALSFWPDLSGARNA
ncbi:hypothetical protein AC579_1654 [Pseudocercospora musae]|uniref:Uncharacterized protein n=1 Tax=Pseudocercospora musae TaxID=113226 RepID=A0A139IAI3_9PEZI|nr:hypothetical protein AC579_1654 [Pseudocercospora musae]